MRRNIDVKKAIVVNLIVILEPWQIPNKVELMLFPLYWGS